MQNKKRLLTDFSVKSLFVAYHQFDKNLIQTADDDTPILLGWIKRKSFDLRFWHP